MSYRKNNPYLSASKKAARGSPSIASPLERRDSISFLEKVGVFLPNSGVESVENIRKRVDGATRLKRTSDSLPEAPYSRSPNKVALEPLSPSRISPIKGFTFESSIRTRESISMQADKEKRRGEELKVLRRTKERYRKEPIVNMVIAQKRNMPKKTVTDKRIDGMKSVYWSPSFNTSHIIPGAYSRDHSTQQWVDTYNKEKDFFISKSKWAQVKLLEITQISKSSNGPSRMLVTIVTQLLLELEDRICESHPAARVAIEHILFSIFKDNRAISQLKNIRADSTLSQRGLSKKLINKVMRMNSYFEEVGHLRDQIHHERNLLPGFQKYLDMLQRQQAAEKRSLELTVKRWQNSMLNRVFNRWRDAIKKQKRAARMLGIYFFKKKKIGLKKLWKEWKIVVARSRYDREKNWEEHAMKQVKEYTKDLGEVREKTMKVMHEIDNVSSAAQNFEHQLEEALAILHDPARQPPTLKKLIIALTSSIKVAGDMALLHQTQNTLECFRKGPDVFRLSTMHITNLPKTEFVEPEFHKEVRAEEDVERTLLSWLPGQFNSVEKTPAFQPFETRDGMLLLQWVNYQLTREPTRSILLKYGHVERGQKKKKGKLLEVPDDLTDCSIYMALNRYSVIPALELRAKVALQEAMGTEDANEDTDDNDNGLVDGFDYLAEEEKFDKFMGFKLYERADRCLKELAERDIVESEMKKQNFHNFKSVELPLGRFITATDITGIPREPTPEEIAKQEARLARLAAREAESGIIVHIMSRYCGQRIHVEGREVPLKFALLAAMVSKSDGCVYLPKEMEKREMLLLEEASLKWNAMRETAVKLAAKGQLAFLHEELVAMNEDYVEKQDRVRKILQWESSCFLKSLPDRKRWHQWRDRLTYLVWQSVCTTVLSRKVKIEEDVDDGSFTTIDRVQLEGSVFKRAGIMDVDDQDEVITQYSDLFKHRIRDLKRIFQYYAAAEAGDANSMDHAEFWKFCRECKFQKDRKALPSVRLDLIFQACNIDFSLSSAERKESDDGEMESDEWVECLCRTSSWRYSKKTAGDLPSRLKKLMNDDMLPNACSVDCDVFRERLAGDEVQAVYKKHKRNTKKIYTVYAADDDDGDAALAMDTMNCKELTSFCMEMKLTGPILSQRAVRTIFAFVQQEEAELDEDEDDDDGSEMVYSEFMEALSAISMFLEPNPYEVVPSRINRFIKKTLIPAAKDNEKTRKVVK